MFGIERGLNLPILNHQNLKSRRSPQKNGIYVAMITKKIWPTPQKISKILKKLPLISFPFVAAAQVSHILEIIHLRLWSKKTTSLTSQMIDIIYS